MAIMRDRVRSLGALLTGLLLGFGSRQAVAIPTSSTKKTATKKTAAKKTASKKKAAVRVSEPQTAALIATGLVAAGAARKLGARAKKQS